MGKSSFVEKIVSVHRYLIPTEVEGLRSRPSAVSLIERWRIDGLKAQSSRLLTGALRRDLTTTSAGQVRPGLREIVCALFSRVDLSSVDPDPGSRQPVLLVITRLRRGPALDRRRLHVWIAKQSCEDIRATRVTCTLRALATPRIVGNGEELATHHIVFAVDRNVGDLALRPFRNRKQRLVLTVNILAEFELAAVVYEGRLVGHVNRRSETGYRFRCC